MLKHIFHHIYPIVLGEKLSKISLLDDINLFQWTDRYPHSEQTNKLLVTELIEWSEFSGRVLFWRSLFWKLHKVINFSISMIHAAGSLKNSTPLSYWNFAKIETSHSCYTEHFHDLRKSAGGIWSPTSHYLRVQPHLIVSSNHLFFSLSWIVPFKKGTFFYYKLV